MVNLESRSGILHYLMTFFVGSAGTALLLIASVAFSPASQGNASPGSETGHVNCKNGRQLEAKQSRHLDTSVCSMNDELLNTAYLPMAYYLLVQCMTPVR